MTPVILDTDIGDDIDDALALALIIASPELELRGVTCVFGNTPARCRLAKSLLARAGERWRAVPVAAGCAGGLSTRPPQNRPREEDLFDQRVLNQERAALDDAELPADETRHGVQLLIDTLRDGSGTIPISIGAMSNLAMALIEAPDLQRSLPRIVSMAGEFDHHRHEWNIICDVEAAARVFACGLPMQVVSWDAGRQATFEQRHLDRLFAAERPFATLLADFLRAWLDAHPGDRPHLYDPLAVAALIRPDFMSWRRGRVSVELCGDATYGYTTFQPDPDGPHEISGAVDCDAFFDWFLDRVLAI